MENRKQILCIVDAQNDFITGPLSVKGADSAVDNIVKLLDTLKNTSAPTLIITTMDTHNENYLETKEGKNLPIPHCIKYTYGWSIDKRVANAVIDCASSNKLISYVGLEKPTFGSLNLIKTISEYVGKEPFTVTFVGFDTDICVISNALLIKTAFYAQADVYVSSGCCAGTTEERHNAALDVMRSCQISVEE